MSSSATFYVGTVISNDFVGGLMLKTDQGVMYQLKNAPSTLKAGQRVKINGELDTTSMGITMIGDILKVLSADILSEA